jgi:hypothetical protein
LAFSLVPSTAAASVSKPVDRHPAPTLAWLVFQAIPSPELVLAGERSAFGLKWQWTPVLYGFGLYRKVSPWRAFVVDPLARQAGSIGLILGPEYLGIGEHASERWLFRAGLSITVPIAERGEALALSLGGGAQIYRGEVGAHVEVGLSTVFGAFGVFLTVSSQLPAAPVILTFRIRYF